MDENLKKILLKMQSDEVNERQIYLNVAKFTKDAKNINILNKIAEEEKAHYNVLFKYTNTHIPIDKKRVWFYSIIARIFGLTFALKEMEERESHAVKGYNYYKITNHFPELSDIAEEEEKHESLLLDILDEERLKYVSSIVLGLNDALVEITGSVAGFTLSMANTKIIALAGLITGISATLSMAASEYIAEKSENIRSAFKSSIYTGCSYFITVILLILPFFLMPKNMYIQALVISLILAVIIILIFNYYISVAKGFSFKKRFLQMTGVSLGVAGLSFIIGILVKNVLRINL
jgi:vacuolar iron transporter family protein